MLAGSQAGAKILQQLDRARPDNVLPRRLTRVAIGEMPQFITSSCQRLQFLPVWVSPWVLITGSWLTTVTSTMG